MKLNIGIKELIEFISGTANAEEVKKTVAGAFLAISDDPVVESALRQRLQQIGEQELRKVIDMGLVQQSGFSSTNRPGGWAFDMVRQAVANELGSVSIKRVIDDAVKAELTQIRTDRAKMVEDIQNITESILQRVLPTMFTKEYADRIAERYDSQTLRKIVAEECVEFMRKSFKG